METGKQQSLLSGNTSLKQSPSSLQVDVEINGVGDFCREFYKEFKRQWYLAGPAMFTSLCQYAIIATTQLFAGQLGTIQLAAVSVEYSVIGAFSYAILDGMGSALETLCGQAYGAGQIDMLGIYLQKSWILLNATAVVLMLTFIFGVSVLRLLGQTTLIATSAGSFAVWMIPQLFAFATVTPITKFLQAQGRIMPMAVIAAVAVISHVVLSWVMVMKLGWGLVGAAVVLDGSWWFITLSQLTYVLRGSCGVAWSGFSWKAFNNLTDFVHVSFATAVMFCSETCYLLSLVLFAGYFDNPEISVDALSICLNILGWVCTVYLGLNVSVSVRVSNELGYGRPKTARLAVIVVAATSLLIGLLFTTVLLVYRKQYPIYFTSSREVIQLVEELTLLLGVSTIVNSIQFALSGVAIGAGWQSMVAYMNIVSYFIVGIPLALLLGFKFNMGVKGLWCGIISGTSMQCCLLVTMISRTNWNNEASIAEDRIKQWGGDIQGEEDGHEKTSYKDVC
ncbi:hypothetical protein QVD17_03990 [Tagetes erecta]|uniref:Protein DETOXIFICATION n=1 Tax=Tagetes erecta TaxID=13708 RepID=A0AAD8L9B8_TARER|nr:hypothetical protein QVD17_03990 [Tagetes erecta]